MLTVAMAWSSCDNNAILYVLPVLWITSHVVTPCSSECTHPPPALQASDIVCIHSAYGWWTSAFAAVRGDGVKLLLLIALFPFFNVINQGSFG